MQKLDNVGARLGTLIVRCAGAAIAVTIASAFASFVAGGMAGVAALIGTGVVAVAITNAENEIIAAVLTGTSAVIASSGIISFFSGNIVKALLLFLCSGIVFGLAIILFFQVVIKLEKLSKTSFEDANLTNAIFDEAIIKDSNFFKFVSN